MAMATEVFNTFWHGRRLMPLEIACMRSFIDHGHRLRVFTYDDFELPKGVENIDARRILPLDRFFLFSGSPSAFTNIFRYKLLFQEGGWWVDADVLCRKADMPNCDYYWAEQQPGSVNGAILKFPQGDALCRRLLELSEQRARNLSYWGQLGPVLLTEVLQDSRPARHAGCADDAYPIRWLETHFFWLPEFAASVQSRIDGSTFVHFWQAMFGFMGLDIERWPPKGSFLDTLYTSHGFAAMPPTDEHADRESVIRYLQLPWVPDCWCNEFKRDIAALGVSEMMSRNTRLLTNI